MAEVLLRDSDGHVWTADAWILAYGVNLDELEAAVILRKHFRVRDPERMYELLTLHGENARPRFPSGTFPEGADIGDIL